MKNIVVIFICIIAFSSCQPLSTINADNSLNANKVEEPNQFDSFYDLSGDRIDLENEDIKGIQVNYAIGWNFDFNGYKKIRKGTQLGECFVTETLSDYYIEYQNNPPSIICNKNSYWVRCSNTIDGVLEISKQDILFYPYYDKQGGNFLFVCERNENNEEAFSNKSKILINNQTINIQPIAISSNILKSDDFIDKISSYIGIKANSYNTLISNIETPIYIDTEIKFSDGISFFPHSDGEGTGLEGTFATGFINTINDITIKQQY